ncbi:MAG: hypothetical protein JNK02_17820 [Planctomycetes bacterium]|nr:hypothetical protein [Planctomycetota bacterium]
MKNPLRTLVAPAAFCALAVPVLLSASGPWTSPRAASELEDAMQTLQASTKSLERALDKAETPKALGLVIEMQDAVRVAKLQTPGKAAELGDEAAKAKFVTGFRLELIELQRGLLDVEAALLQGKADEAKKALDARVKPLKKRGHDAYKD